MEIVRDKTGMILLSVTPENAKVTIDGKSVDISSAIELPYGIHQVRLEAVGYDSLTKYIQVGSEYAKISFTLEEKRESSDYSLSQNDLEEQNSDKDSSADEDTLNATSTNRVYIDAPKNVEVYVDGNYIGMSPISFKKVLGSHTVTLRKSGYVTKSYTIYLYNDGEDITYSFTDLEKVSSTASGNSSSSSTKSSSSSSTQSGSVSDNDVGDGSSDNGTEIEPDPNPDEDDEDESENANTSTTSYKLR